MEEEKVLGDIIINLYRAVEQAEEFGTVKNGKWRIYLYTDFSIFLVMIIMIRMRRGKCGKRKKKYLVPAVWNVL